MVARQVTIGPEFFKKEFNNYENWRWAYIREALQNSIDAPGTKKIELSIYAKGSDTVIEFKNDGVQMTEDTVINKLFALGSSGKDFGNGSVGGFGVAKTILYFAHKSYRIRTGNLLVEGAGAHYDISTVDEFLGGTSSNVLIEGDHVDALVEQTNVFARYAQWSGELRVNGEVLHCNNPKGSRRRDLGFGVIYTNKSEEYKLVVRIGGIPMFTSYCGHDRLVIVELYGASNEVLTSNRDGLVYPYRGELSSFITELSVDTRSAFRSNVPRYEHFDGQKLGYRRHDPVNVLDLVSVPKDIAEPAKHVNSVENDSTFEDSGKVCDGVSVGESPNSPGSISVGVCSGKHVRASSFSGSSETRRVATLGAQFTLKNETNLVVPNYYRPDSPEFSSYARKLIKIWGRAMLEMHRLFNHEDEFGVGFIFDDSTEAEHEVGDYGRVYYISPAKVVEQTSSNSKSFAKRWKLTDRNRVLMVALHEFIHGLGNDFHDERYANLLTDMSVKVIDEKKRFSWCFKP